MPTLSSMLPTAGLFLPETLNRGEFPTTAPMETQRTSLKYLQRRYGRSKQNLKDSEAHLSATALDESRDEPPTDFPAIPTAYSFADHVLYSEKASPDLLNFVKIIRLVRIDVEEADRLYLSSVVSNFLDAFPAKRIWIEGSLREVRRALDEIGKDMDAALGQEKDGGTITLRRKIDWGLKNQKKLLKKQQQLNACHSQLTGAIYVMQTAELCGKPGAIAQDPIFEAPVRPWLPHDEMNAQRGPYSRQKYRTSQTNLSASNLTLSSEAQLNVFQTTSEISLPVELAGSTPNDMVLAERHSSQDFISPQVSRDSIAEGPSLLRRPRARSDYSRSAFTRGKMSRASIDDIASSSKLEDNSLERNDSTISTKATISMPMIARRYRATSVDIGRHTDKHTSLPSQLPHLTSQPSLIDDMAGYVMPSTRDARFLDRELTVSPCSSMPSISVTSSPVIGHALSAVPEKTSKPDKSPDASLLSTIEGANSQLYQKRDLPDDEAQAPPQQQGVTVTISPKMTQDNWVSKRKGSDTPERSTSSLSYHSTSNDTPRSPSSLASVTLVPNNESARRPSSQRPSQRIAKKRSHISSSRSFVSAPSPALDTMIEPPATPGSTRATNNEDAATCPIAQTAPKIDIDGVSQHIPVHITDAPQELDAAPDDNDAVLSVLQRRLGYQKQVKVMAENLVRAASDAAELIIPPPATTEATKLPTTEPKHPSAVEATAPSPVELPAQVPFPAIELPGSIPRKPLPDTTPIPVYGLTSSAPSVSSEDRRETNPMSAMAKRRAAQARRMHIAFGGAKGGL